MIESMATKVFDTLVNAKREKKGVFHMQAVLGETYEVNQKGFEIPSAEIPSTSNAAENCNVGEKRTRHQAGDSFTMQDPN